MEISDQLHAPTTLLPGKELGGAPEPVCMRLRRVKIPAPAGNWTHALVTMLTELSWLPT